MAWTVEDDYPKSSTDQRLYESRHVLALTRPAVDEVDDGTVTPKMSTDHTALALDLERRACRPLSLGSSWRRNGKPQIGHPSRRHGGNELAQHEQHPEDQLPHPPAQAFPSHLAGQPPDCGQRFQARPAAFAATEDSRSAASAAKIGLSSTVQRSKSGNSRRSVATSSGWGGFPGFTAIRSAA